MSEVSEYPKKLTAPYEVEGAVRDTDFDEMDPVLTFKADSRLNGKNYAYMPTTGMYYHVVDRNRTRTGLIQITFHFDPLMKYLDEVKECDGLLVRSELYGNFYLSDDQVPLQQDTMITYSKFYESPFNGFSIIMGALNTARADTTDSGGGEV